MVLNACMYFGVGFEDRITSVHIVARNALRIKSIAGFTAFDLTAMYFKGFLNLRYYLSKIINSEMNQIDVGIYSGC